MVQASEQSTDLVSIIIPVYNTGTILSETLDSCLNQTYPNLEILVIDDHSNDAITLEVLSSYAQKDSRIKVITSVSNHGAGYSRNKGVEHCQGKYFTFLDSDDLLVEDFVEKLLKALIENHADMAESLYQPFFDGNKEEFKTDSRVSLQNKSNNKQVEYFGQGLDDIRVLNHQKIMDQALIFRFAPQDWARLFVTKSYIEAGLSFSHARYCQDFDWTVRVFTTLKRFVFVPVIGVKYRVRHGSISSGSLAFWKGHLDARVRVYDYLSQKTELNKFIPLCHRVLCSSFSLESRYNLLKFCKTEQERQENLEYIFESFSHCGLDLNKSFKSHGFSTESSRFLRAFANVLGQGKNLAPILLVSFHSLFDSNDPEMFYCQGVFQQLGKKGLQVQALTTNLGFDGQALASLRDFRQQVREFIEFKRNDAMPLGLDFVVCDHSFCSSHGYNSYTIVERKSGAQSNQDESLTAVQKRFEQFFYNLVIYEKFKNIVFVGRSPLVDKLALAFKNVRKTHVILSRDLSVQELASGNVEATPWADQTVSLFKQGYMLPVYPRPEPNFENRKYVTMICPNCEHGLAITIKLSMLLKKLRPEQKVLIIANTHNDLLVQLRTLHTTDGQSLLSLEDDHTNMVFASALSDFSIVWHETKVLLQLSPQHPNCHGLTLESLYNYVPVLATAVSCERGVGSMVCQVPPETQQDITCLPDDSSMEEIMQDLEKLLGLSPEEIKSSCDALVEQYPQGKLLDSWLDLVQGASCQD